MTIVLIAVGFQMYAPLKQRLRECRFGVLPVQAYLTKIIWHSARKTLHFPALRQVRTILYVEQRQ